MVARMKNGIAMISNRSMPVKSFSATDVIGTMGAKFVYGLMHTDQVSPDLEIPSWFVYLCIPLGSYLMCFRFLQVAYAYWRTGELPHHDHAHVEGVEVEEPGIGAAGVTR